MIEQSVSLASTGVVKVPGYEQLVRFGYTKNRGVYRLAVTASGEWEGLAIRCFWHVPDGKDPASSLVIDGSVDVPASVTAQPGSGCVTFEGSDGTKTVTSADLRYRVSANSGTEDGTEPEPGTPAWQQLVDAVHTDATAAEQAKTDAQTAAQQAGASASAASTSAAHAGQSAQQAADNLQALKDGIANGDFKGEKGDTGPAVALDTTLTHEGEAADAKATGEAIQGVRDDLVAEGARAKGAENQLKEDIGNIKKKKNVVIYVGSAELSAEQKLSCDYVCDGVDDQIEIRQAIDSLPDSGGEIHLSRGIFNISNSIVINKRIKIVGEGKGITLDRNNVNNGGTTLLSELTGGCIILIQKSDTLSDIKGITLSDFQIVGAGINVENNYCNGINVTTYTDCVTLERLAICHCFYGLFVDQSATVDDISVTNCDFQRDTTGIYIYGQGWQTRIENNIFWDMSGLQATSGIMLSAGKNIVNGNYFGVSSLVSQERINAWVFAKNSVSLLCNGNSFSRCTSSPIRFEAGGQFASISGNSFSEIGKAQFQPHERAVLYVDGAGTGGGRISFTNNTVFWANDDDWKTSYLAYLTNQVAQVNISNNTVIDGIGKITEDELVYKSEDSAYAITIGNNVLC